MSTGAERWGVTEAGCWQMRNVGFLADGDIYGAALHRWRIKLGERTEACAYRLLGERRPAWPSIINAPNGLPLFVRHAEDPCDCSKMGHRRRAGAGAMTDLAEPEWWGVAEAASHCGIRPGTWRDYVARGRAPQPDDPDVGAPPQRRRPRWRAETVTAWQASRPRAPRREETSQ